MPVRPILRESLRQLRAHPEVWSLGIDVAGWVPLYSAFAWSRTVDGYASLGYLFLIWGLASFVAQAMLVLAVNQAYLQKGFSFRNAGTICLNRFVSLLFFEFIFLVAW